MGIAMWAPDQDLSYFGYPELSASRYIKKPMVYFVTALTSDFGSVEDRDFSQLSDSQRYFACRAYQITVFRMMKRIVNQRRISVLFDAVR
jgi:hypothetical protein